MDEIEGDVLEILVHLHRAEIIAGPSLRHAERTEDEIPCRRHERGTRLLRARRPDGDLSLLLRENTEPLIKITGRGRVQHQPVKNKFLLHGAQVSSLKP